MSEESPASKSDETSTTTSAQPPTPPPVPPKDAPPLAYDVHATLGRLTATYARLDALRGRGQRRELAEELCTFFRQLSGDADFWNWLRGLEPADPQDQGEISVLLEDLSGFQTRQAKLLTAMKVGESQANTLAQVFTTNMNAFQGLLKNAAHMVSPEMAVQSMQFYLSGISEAVCRDPTWANITKAMGAIGTIVSMVGGITLAASPAGVVVAVAAGALSLGSVAIGYVHDRRR